MELKLNVSRCSDRMDLRKSFTSLMASFTLLTLGGQIGQINGGIRYVLLNLLASALFLAAAGVIYGTIGTLNMAHIALRMPSAPESIQIFIAGLLLIAFSIAFKSCL